MAKIYGLFGAMTGKVADAVMVVRNGEQIVRKYQPIVSNPNTQAQVAVRARLKLMSQLSAVMAPFIAMPRVGAVSSRNLFVKTNFGQSSYSNNEANINLTGVKLTKSVLALQGVFVSRGSAAGELNCSVSRAGLDNVSRVVYVAFVKTAENELRLGGSSVTTNAEGGYPAVINVGSNDAVVVYAYGVRDNTDAARVLFGNMIAPAAESIAKIIVSRTLTEVDVTLTETKSIELPAAA